MKHFNLVTRQVVDKKGTMFCIPLHNYKQMTTYTPTCKDIEELERVMDQ